MSIWREIYGTLWWWGFEIGTRARRAWRLWIWPAIEGIVRNDLDD